MASGSTTPAFLHQHQRWVDSVWWTRKPLSGGGARGLMLDAMKTYGADSFVGRTACVLNGASETTFYVLAVYFGSVNVKNTRYAAAAGLLADLGGVIAAISLSYLFFH